MCVSIHQRPTACVTGLRVKTKMLKWRAREYHRRTFRFCHSVLVSSPSRRRWHCRLAKEASSIENSGQSAVALSMASCMLAGCGVVFVSNCKYITIGILFLPESEFLKHPWKGFIWTCTVHIQYRHSMSTNPAICLQSLTLKSQATQCDKNTIAHPHYASAALRNLVHQGDSSEGKGNVTL
jgi:hypothetical protein